MEKASSKKSLSRNTSSTNRNHTSSINIKLSHNNPDISQVDHFKIPLKTIFKDKCEPYLRAPQKKYSVKLPSNEKENHRRKEHYEVGLRPFQETNRYLETERAPKEHSHSKRHHERSLSKQFLKLKSDQHLDSKLRT